MKNEIISIKIKNELDIVLSYKRARQLAEFTGMALPLQTKFATAVSEISRNVLEHVGEGNIYFSIVDKESDLFLEAIIIDFGKGIANIDRVLSNIPHSTFLKGWGIFNAKKLVDFFKIDTGEALGTKVTIRKKLPARRPLINNALVKEWQSYFSKETSVSPYEEIKSQYAQLVEMMEMLRLKNMEVESQLQEIVRLNYNLDQYAYTISHDLKAPLKNMEALVALFKQATEDKDLALSAKMCPLMENQLNKMDKLIQDVLAYSTQGKHVLEKKEIIVSDLVTEVIMSLIVPPDMQISISRDMPDVNGEEVLLKQIFSNLISNSIKHNDMPKGTIKIGTDKANGQDVFYVEDNGPGIPKEFHKKIFRLFESLTSKSKDSTGVGLSIVKNIIEEKGGSIWVESEGRGSKFCFTWPQ